MRRKWDTLIANGVISAEELALATRIARKRGVDVELVLDANLQVGTSVLGEALAQFYGVPYEPFLPERDWSADLCGNISRGFAIENGWVALEETSGVVVILTTDPERVAKSGTVKSIYPGSNPAYRVCTCREFEMALDKIFGPVYLDGKTGQSPRSR